MAREPRLRPSDLLLFSFITSIVLALGAGANVGAGTGRPAQPGPGAAPGQLPAASQPGEWHITAKKYAYSVPRIEVQQDDLVKITLEAVDIPHSFTIDEPYRIAKRATPGHPVVFEFRADKPGTFEFYCNLKADDGCRAMKGRLVVRPKRSPSTRLP